MRDDLFLTSVGDAGDNRRQRLDAHGQAGATDHRIEKRGLSPTVASDDRHVETIHRQALEQLAIPQGSFRAPRQCPHDVGQPILGVLVGAQVHGRGLLLCAGESDRIKCAGRQMARRIRLPRPVRVRFPGAGYISRSARSGTANRS